MNHLPAQPPALGHRSPRRSIRRCRAQSRAPYPPRRAHGRAGAARARQLLPHRRLLAIMAAANRAPSLPRRLRARLLQVNMRLHGSPLDARPPDCAPATLHLTLLFCIMTRYAEIGERRRANAARFLRMLAELCPIVVVVVVSVHAAHACFPLGCATAGTTTSASSSNTLDVSRSSTSSSMRVLSIELVLISCKKARLNPATDGPLARFLVYPSLPMPPSLCLSLLLAITTTNAQGSSITSVATTPASSSSSSSSCTSLTRIAHCSIPHPLL